MPTQGARRGGSRPRSAGVERRAVLRRPKRSRTILNRSDRSCLRGAVRRRPFLQPFWTACSHARDECLNLVAQRENFVTRRFAEITVVARLPLLKRAGQWACRLVRNEAGATEMFLEQTDDAAVPRRVKISSCEQRASSVESGIDSTRGSRHH